MVYIFGCGFLRSFARFCCLRAPGSVGVDRLGVDAFSVFLLSLKMETIESSDYSSTEIDGDDNTLPNAFLPLPRGENVFVLILGTPTSCANEDQHRVKRHRTDESLA